jgi:hypothetical protein
MRGFLLLVLLFSGCSHAGQGLWLGARGGMASQNQNALDKLSPPVPPMANEKMGTYGASFGGRTGTFLKIFRLYYDLYVNVAPKHSTPKALGEWTGNVSQTTFGVTYGFYLTDWFYFYLDPVPYLNFIYTTGSKLRPNPGRTTSMSRSWDQALAFGAGLEHKFGKSFSLGVEYRDLSTWSRSFGWDSSGFGYDNQFVGLVAKIWY